MLTVDYSVSKAWGRESSSIDLAKADAMTLRYKVFLGDIILLADGVDLSAKWGWIPIVDVAAGLLQISRELSTSDGVRVYEFTESEATLRFTRTGTSILISSSYCDATARVPHSEFSEGVSVFAQRVFRDFTSSFPVLKTNPSFPALLAG